jgi:hypothetical protein
LTNHANLINSSFFLFVHSLDYIKVFNIKHIKVEFIMLHRFVVHFK